MRSDLDHLPRAKRDELAMVERILFAEFEDALVGRTAPHRRAARILKVILFGSYARGDWVADPVGGYFSDYDLLVVVNHEELTDVAKYWALADDRLTRELMHGRLATPVNFIVHSYADLNRHLRKGRPFFADIVRDGVVLYEAPDHPLEPCAPLSPAEAAAEAARHASEWLPSAAKFIRAGEFLQADDAPKEAAFQFHQAAERLYHATLLVLTLYSPKSHRLGLLRSQAEGLAPALVEAWPRDSRFAKRAFELLRRAYIEARYSRHYSVTAAELDWVAERVRTLQRLVQVVCDDRLRGDTSECDQ